MSDGAYLYVSDGLEELRQDRYDDFIYFDDKIKAIISKNLILEETVETLENKIEKLEKEIENIKNKDKETEKSLDKDDYLSFDL